MSAKYQFIRASNVRKLVKENNKQCSKDFLEGLDEYIKNKILKCIEVNCPKRLDRYVIRFTIADLSLGDFLQMKFMKYQGKSVREDIISQISEVCDWLVNAVVSSGLTLKMDKIDFMIFLSSLFFKCIENFKKKEVAYGVRKNSRGKVKSYR